MMGWRFDEYAPVGVDLGSAAAVAAYDRNQGTDPEADGALLDRLGVGPGTTYVDLACGTGSMVREAARRGADAHGVDVSAQMLAFARSHADAAGLDAHWHHAGFLDYEHASPVDVVSCRSALHQLPDFWKQVALLRAADLLRPGGTYYLADVVFGFDPRDQEGELTAWLDRVSRPPGEGFTRADLETHLREEYSTYRWILEGMLHRAGLAVETSEPRDPIYAEYLCRRP